MASGRYLLRVHSRPDEGKLADLWSGEARGFETTPFQTPGFLRSFYRNLPENCGPLVLSVTERASGRLAMVLPLLMREAAGVRHVEATDLGLSDYVAPVVADWFRPTAQEMAAIWRLLYDVLPAADILSLKKVPARLARDRANPLAMLPGAMDMGITTKTLDLGDEESGDHYRRTGLYKDGMRQLRKLGRLGAAEFRIAQTREEALAQFEHLLEQRLARFRALDRDDPLSQDEVRTFYREIVAEGVPSGEVLFGGLYLDGDCVATDLGLVLGDTHHGIFTTMKDGELRKLSPGTIAFMLILDETAARGIRYYDIGVGEFAYKGRLPGEEMPLYERHEALTLRGRMALAEARMRRAVRIGLSRYPALRGPADAVRQRLRRLRKWAVAAAAGLIDWPALHTLIYVAEAA